MIVFLTLIYVGLLYLLTKTGKVPNTKATWLTIIPYMTLLLVALFIPMQWGAPAGVARVLTYSVAIVPNVAGEVIEVPVQMDKPMKKGDVLFKIDPVPYQAALDGLNAQLKLAQLRYKQTQELIKQKAGTAYELQSFQAQIEGLQAKIMAAEYNLKETVVRAPSDGYATNVLLRVGARAVTFPISPSMSFIDMGGTEVVAQIHQIYTQYIEPGQKAEVTFKTRPGEVFPATVKYLVPVTAQGQVKVSGAAALTLSTAPGPFTVRLKLDDEALEASLKPGALGEVAIYTSHIEIAHVIRQVMIRMNAIMNYIDPS